MSVRVSFTKVRSVVGNSCMVACHTWRFAASIKNNKNGMNVAPSTTSYSELSLETNAARTGCDSATATMRCSACCPSWSEEPISETCSSTEAIFCSTALATACRGARYVGQSLLNWSKRSTKDHATNSKTAIVKRTTISDPSARGICQFSMKVTTGSKKYASNTATRTVTRTDDAQ